MSAPSSNTIGSAAEGLHIGRMLLLLRVFKPTYEVFPNVRVFEHNGKHPGITLPPGDGIILLADRIVAPLAMPAGIDVSPAGNGAIATWHKNTQYVAGYHIVYAENPLQPTRAAIVAADASPFLEIEDLNSATAYYFKIAAFDFYGDTGPYTAPVALVTPPIFEPRPDCSFESTTAAIAPGSLARIVGVNLASSAISMTHAPFPPVLGSTVVFLNSIPAPLRTVSPGRIDFVVPWELAESNVVVYVVRDGVRSSDGHSASLNCAEAHRYRFNLPRQLVRSFR